MTTTMPVKESVRVLTRARELLVTEGWVQHATFSQGRRCLAAAICATSEHPSEALTAVTRVLFPEATPNVGCVINWNDRPGRTKEEVLEVLDRAIAKELGLP